MKRWERAVQAMKLQEAAGLAGQGLGSQRHVAEQVSVPRSTLQYWPQRPGKLEAAPEVVAFLESPEGLAFLHRWVVAAHVVMTLLGSGGIRRVGVWLELTGLDRFVAASSPFKVATQNQWVTAEFRQELCQL